MRGFLLVLLALLLVTSPLTAAPRPRTITADVLVIGGTPAGIAAAAAAARMGARVHLVEALPKMGGVITWAWLTTFDLNLTPEGTPVTRGIFQEYYRALGTSFDLEDAIEKLTWEVYREVLVGSTTNAPMTRLHVQGRRAVGAEFDDRDWKRTLTVNARQVIDATDDADVAATAKVPFMLGRPGAEGVPWMQAVTLIYRIGGVNWNELVADLLMRKTRGANPAAWGVNGKAAWGYQDVLKQYRPIQPDVSTLGLNLALQNDGSVLINNLQIYGVNGLVAAEVEEGFARAKRELPNLARFLRERIPGFGESALVDHAPMLYIRETRHIKGFHTLTADDILRERIFWDRIGAASYPIDIHPYVPGWVNPHPPVRHVYTLPFRTLVPVGVDNLLVASRAFSATSEAAGSARVIPTTMAMGQAAGVAAALCARRGCTPAGLLGTPSMLAEVQELLRAQGAYLGPAAKP